MTRFHEVIQDIKKSVVGIGLERNLGKKNAQILGTGFVYHPDGIIITNKHVADQLTESDSHRTLSLKKNAVAVFFVPVKNQPSAVQLIVISVVKVSTLRARTEKSPLKYDSPPDLAVLYLHPNAKKDLGPFPYLRLSDASRAAEGDPVAICGFPHGLLLPEQQDYAYNSVVQKGILSAVMPHPAVDDPSVFLVDIPVQLGSSGSPLFDCATGEILGVIFGTRVHNIKIRTNGQENSLTIPTFPGFAVPIKRCLRAIQSNPETPKPPTESTTGKTRI